MGEVIVVTSGKGGVGKTTVSANLSVALARLNQRVVVIDTDIGLRNLDVVMGLENHIVYNLVDVVEGNCRIKQALIKDKRFNELYLLPSAQTKDKTCVTPEQMTALTNELKDSFDFVILDCPAGIEQGFKNAIAGATRALVVTTPEVSAIRDADRIIGLLENDGIHPIHLIVNRIRNELIKNGDMMSIEDVKDILGVDIIGTIPDDVSIVVSTNRGEPLNDKDTVPGQVFANIAKRVLGEEIPMMNLTKEKKLFSGIFRGKNKNKKLRGDLYGI